MLNIFSKHPFTLTEEAAVIEAKKLVSNRQVWTHKLNGKVVSIAAFTRNTRQVVTITKVINHIQHNLRQQSIKKKISFSPCRSTLTLHVGDTVAQNVWSDTSVIRKFCRPFKNFEQYIDK